MAGTTPIRDPDVHELAARLRECIDRAAGAGVVEAAVTPTRRFVRFEEADVEQSVAERFPSRVAMYPDRLAIKSETHALTYAELNRFANSIAHTILTRTSRKGDQVGLLFRQQAPMIAASLGALKAGRVYVALDPTYPKARQDFILEDAGVGIILTDSDLFEQAEGMAKGRIVVDVGTFDPEDSAQNPGLSISPDAGTYIVYTSGSTGKPKGVVENQRNVLHFTFNNTNTWQLCADDRISLVVPYWFSASATATFGALLNGATLLPMNVRERGLADLADWLVQEQITIFHASTSLFRHFARALPEGKVFDGVRLIYLGAEALFRTDVDLYKQHFADYCRMANNLGASEKTFSTFQIDKHTEIADRVVPVSYRFLARRCSCSTRTISRLSRVRSVRSSSAQNTSRSAIGDAPTSPRAPSSQTRSPLVSACTTRATWKCTRSTRGRIEALTSGAETSRSRSAGIGWSWVTSRQPCWSCLNWPKRSSSRNTQRTGLAW